MNLSISQLVALAQAAGFSGPDLLTAVAVALAESGGNPQAYNPESAAGAPQGQGSFGLWQIYLKAHPQFSGANLFDPGTNAAAAYSIYSSAGGFSPWSTFTSGAYQGNLAAVNAAMPQAPVMVATDGTDTTGTTTDATTVSSGIGDGEILGIVAFGGLAFWVLSKLL